MSPEKNKGTRLGGNSVSNEESGDFVRPGSLVLPRSDVELRNGRVADKL